MTSATYSFPDSTVAVTVAEDACLGPGGTVWDAAVVLAGSLVLETASGSLVPAGKVAIELGAGAGLPGLTLAALGATVTLTDKPVLGALQRANAAANGLADAVSVKPFLFGGSPKKLGKRAGFDIILCSDVLGCGDASAYPDLVRGGPNHERTAGSQLVTVVVSAPAQVKTLDQLCGPSTVVYMSYRERAAFEGEFFDLIRPLFDVAVLRTVTKASAWFPFRDVCDADVTVYTLRRSVAHVLKAGADTAGKADKGVLEAKEPVESAADGKDAGDGPSVPKRSKMEEGVRD